MRRRAGDEVPQRRQVARLDARLVQQPVDHRRRQEQLGHPVLLDRVEQSRRVRPWSGRPRCRRAPSSGSAARRPCASWARPRGSRPARRRGSAQLIMKLRANVWKLRCVFITPLGMPVVPPVGASETTSSGSERTPVSWPGAVRSTRRTTCPPARRRRPERTHCLTAGRRSRSWRSSPAEAAWKITTSRRRLRAARGLAARARRVDRHPGQPGAPDAQDADPGDRIVGREHRTLGPGRGPEASSALAIRHDSRPTSAKV